MEWPPKQLPRNFPLTVTGRGYVKHIAGKARWICGKRTPEEALKVYHRKAAALIAGRRPLAEALPPPAAGANVRLTMHDLLNRWLIDRRGDAGRGELSAGAWQQYKLSAKRLDKVLGHYAAADVSPDVVRAAYDRLAADFKPDFAKRAVGHLRTACRHAEEHGWCPPVRLGAKLVAKLAARPQPRMRWQLLTPAQVRAVLAELDRRIAKGDGRSLATLYQLRAMVLLALNGGFNSMEVSELTKAQVEVAAARLRHTRGKTGAEHFVPLWPETLAALAPVLAQRPDDPLLFRTREGNPWNRMAEVRKDGKLVKAQGIDNVKYYFTPILKHLGLHTPGQSFGKLRHCHASTGDEAGDTPAAMVLMGHAVAKGARAAYVAVSWERIKRVSDHVRHVLLVTPLDQSANKSSPGAGASSGD
jgi:integrase